MAAATTTSVVGGSPSIARAADGPAVSHGGTSSADDVAVVEHVTVSYDAPVEICPHEDVLVREISIRTSKFQRTENRAQAARGLHVRITRNEEGGDFNGELTLREGRGEAVRVVRDEQCAVVVSAIALIAALAIDPEASTAPVEAIAPKPIPPPVENKPVLNSEAVAPAPLPPATADSRMAIGASVGVAFRTGIVPSSPAVTAAVVISFASIGSGFARFTPQARAELSLGAKSTQDAGGPAAELQWFGGHLEACAIKSTSDVRWGFGPCALIELGGLQAEAQATSTSRIRDAQSVTRFGAAGGAGLRAVMRSGAFYADLGAFALVPFRRDRFYVDPAITLFEPTVVGAQVGAAVGALF